MNNFSVLNCNDGDQPVVIGCAGSKNLAVYFVFEDYDASILTGVRNSGMHNEPVAGMNVNGFAVSREAGDQISASSNNERPAREVITGLEDCIVGKRVEIVLAIDKSAQALHDNFKEWIQGFVRCIFCFWHWRPFALKNCLEFYGRVMPSADIRLRSA
jgi:hypothetical protein